MSKQHANGVWEFDNIGDDFGGDDWVCPQCGKENTAWSRMGDNCTQCNYKARSYTGQIRNMLKPYEGRDVEVNWTPPGRKGRRKYKAKSLVGTFQTVSHTKQDGWIIELRLYTSLKLNLPLSQLGAEGAKLGNVLSNLGWQKRPMNLASLSPLPLLGSLSTG